MRKLEDIAPLKIKWSDIYSKNIANEEPYEFFLKCTAIKICLLHWMHHHILYLKCKK